MTNKTETRHDLTPTDGRKSFYGKAYTITDGTGETLYSYNTPILRAEGGRLIRIWMGWSATTGRHIRAFCGLNKAEFLALPTD